jgi:hypothetical protein
MWYTSPAPYGTSCFVATSYGTIEQIDPQTPPMVMRLVADMGNEQFEPMLDTL